MPQEEQALRVVLDPRGKVPENALVLDARARTLVVALEDCGADAAVADPGGGHFTGCEAVPGFYDELRRQGLALDLHS